MYNVWSHIVLVLLHKRLKSLTILQKNPLCLPKRKITFPYTWHYYFLFIKLYDSVSIWGEKDYKFQRRFLKNTYHVRKY